MLEPLSSYYSEETQTALRQLQWYVATGRFSFMVYLTSSIKFERDWILPSGFFAFPNP